MGVERGVGREIVVIAIAHHAPAVRVPLLAQGDHLLHLVRRNHGVARLPEEDAGVVAEVDDRVAHHFERAGPTGVP